jgi:hypothetical protein
MGFIAALWAPSRVDGERCEQALRSFRVLPSSSMVAEYAIDTTAPACVMANRGAGNRQHTRIEKNAFASVALLGFNEFLDKPWENCSAVDLLKGIASGEGEFVCMVMEATGALHVINDRFASRPCYMMRKDDGRFLFSSNLSFLLHLNGHVPPPDPLGWLQMFNYSHTVDSRTTFDGVCRLRPATHLTVREGRLDERRYWRVAYDVQENLNAPEFADAVFKAFRASAAKRAANRRGVVALSGGLDSRLLAAAVPNERFSALTLVGPLSALENPEVNVAATVAGRLGFEHAIRRLQSESVSSSAEDTVALVGGLTPLHHPTKVMLMISEVARAGGYLLGGGPGDTLAGAFIRSASQLDHRHQDRVIRRYVRNKRSATVQGLRLVYRKDILREFLPQLDKTLAETFESVPGPTAAHRITAWTQTFRQPAFTFTSPIHTHPDVSESFAHLGYEYVDLMLKLPASWLFRKSFYKFMIHRCIPELRDVVYANTGERLAPDLVEHAAGSVWLAAMTEAGRGLGRRVVPRRLRAALRGDWRDSSSVDFHMSMLCQDRQLLTTMEERLGSSRSLAAIFDTPRCIRVLRQIRKEGVVPTECSSDMLGSLATACYTYTM